MFCFEVSLQTCSLPMYCVLSFPGKKKRGSKCRYGLLQITQQSGDLAWGKKNTASVLLLWNEKHGERERLRRVLQQIQQKTKELCIRSCIYSSSHNAVTVTLPRSSCDIMGSATSSGTQREVFCETWERDHTLPSYHLHSGLILGKLMLSLLLGK